MNSLKEYRSLQRRLAIIRDAGLCTVCWFVENKKTNAVHVHHVYGRAQRINEEKEHFTKLLCVCFEHHVSPILVEKSDVLQIEEVLHKANVTPINTEFIFRGKSNNGIET